MVTLHVATLDGGPDLVIPNAEWVAVGFFWLDASSRAGGIDELAGLPPLNRVMRADLTAINRTFVARSSPKHWTGIVDAGHLRWLSRLDPEWDLIAMDEDLWHGTARPALRKALEALDRPYIRRAVATKMLHLKRPRLAPVLDSLVVRQLRGRVPDTVEGTILLADHMRTAGRGAQADLVQIQRHLLARGLDRSLARILDGLLWSNDPASGFGMLGPLVEDILSHVEGDGPVAAK